MKTLTKAERIPRKAKTHNITQEAWWYLDRARCCFNIVDHGNTYQILVPTRNIRRALAQMDKELNVTRKPRT